MGGGVKCRSGLPYCWSPADDEFGLGADLGHRVGGKGASDCLMGPNMQ